MIIRRSGPIQVAKGWANLWRQGRPVPTDVGPGIYIYRPVLPTRTPAEESAAVFMRLFENK